MKNGFETTCLQTGQVDYHFGYNIYNTNYVNKIVHFRLHLNYGQEYLLL